MNLPISEDVDRALLSSATLKVNDLGLSALEPVVSTKLVNHQILFELTGFRPENRFCFDYYLQQPIVTHNLTVHTKICLAKVQCLPIVTAAVSAAASGTAESTAIPRPEKRTSDQLPADERIRINGHGNISLDEGQCQRSGKPVVERHVAPEKESPRFSNERCIQAPVSSWLGELLMHCKTTFKDERT